MLDSRLIGIWKSHTQKVAREILARRDIPASKKRELRSLFGKLELRYTRTHIHALLNGKRAISRYIVVAKDSSSVGIVSFNALTGPVISHTHFEGKHSWIGLGKIREYFKKK